MSATQLLDQLLARVSAVMPPEEVAQLKAQAVGEMETLRWLPNPGPQYDAVHTTADQLLYGGKAGAGKSDVLIGLACTQHRRSLLLRRLNKEVHFLVDRTEEILGHSKGYNGQDKRWYLPDDRLIMYGGCQHSGDEKGYKGEPKDLIGIDEASEFLESQVDFLTGWLRTKDPKQKVRLVFATNPPTSVDGEWIIRWFAPWLDPEHSLYPYPAGKLLYFERLADGFRWEEEPFEIELKGGKTTRALSRTFIPGDLADNPDYAKTDYSARLAALPEELRRRYERGEWIGGAQDDEFQVIPTAWIAAAQARWTAEAPTDVPMTAMGVDIAQGGCFDDQTEILTDHGWKLFEQLTGTEQVLTLNGDVAEWGGITELHKYRHDGPMNLWDRRGLSFCITDNHRLVASSTGTSKGKWKIRRYDELPKFFSIRRSNCWGGSEFGPVQFSSIFEMPNGGERRYDWEFSELDWAAFLGWFVSEGCVFKEKRKDGRWRINIAQKRGAKFDMITALLERMRITYRMPSSRSGVEFSINVIGEHLAQHCGIHAANKRIPAYIKNAKPPVIEAFLSTYRLGDGMVNGSGVTQYATTSRELADDLQEVLAKLGRAGSLSVTQEAGSSFQIGDRKVVRKRAVFGVRERLSADSDITKAHVKRVHYCGFVYCVSTPLQTILVRRKGQVMWSGNSDKTVVAPRYGSWFAPLVKVPGIETPDGPTAAALVVKYLRDGAQVNIDMGGGWGGSCYDHLKENDLTSVLGVVPAASSSGKTSDGKLQFTNLRCEMLWRLREGLDPNSGMNIALPKSATLRADLAAARWKLTSSGIRIEEKTDIKKRLGRSPDEGDAVCLAWYSGSARVRKRGHRVAKLPQNSVNPNRNPRAAQRHRAMQNSSGGGEQG